MKAKGFDSHDHQTCRRTLLAAAQARCAELGARLTPQRQRVLELLLDQHRAIGAYEILDLLRAEGHAAQPPVAYRALDFLVKHGLAHKVERLNAFVACSHPNRDHSPALLICRKCHLVAEAPADLTQKPLAATASESGFALEVAIVEAEGLCPDCQDPGA